MPKCLSLRHHYLDVMPETPDCGVIRRRWGPWRHILGMDRKARLSQEIRSRLEQQAPAHIYDYGTTQRFFVQ